VATQDGRPDPLGKAGAAAEAAKTAPLDAPARDLLRPDHSPRDYLAALDQAGYLPDAARFLAFALPRREAVWWAAQCVRRVPALMADEPAAAALVAAEAWAADPTDDRRRAAFAAAESAGFDKPAACTALAAFLSDGSLAPAQLQAVPPPTVRREVAAAVVLAALATEPENGDAKLRTFLALGSEVAAGANRWKEARPTPGPAPGPGQRAPVTPPDRPAPSPPPPSRGWY